MFENGRLRPLKTFVKDDKVFLYSMIDGNDVYIDKAQTVLVSETYENILIEYDTLLNYKNHRILQTTDDTNAEHNIELSTEGDIFLTYFNSNLADPAFAFVDTNSISSIYFNNHGLQSYSSATVKFDGSCPTGCTDSTAVNYDPNSICSDSSCILRLYDSLSFTVSASIRIVHYVVMLQDVLTAWLSTMIHWSVLPITAYAYMISTI